MTDRSNDNQPGDAASKSGGAHAAEDVATNASPDPEVAQLQADIERRREDLAHTMDQLTAKLDVKSRTKERAAEIKQQANLRVQALRDKATDEQGKPTTATISAAGGVAAGVVVLVVVTVWRRRRARQSSQTLAALRRGARRGR